MDLEGGTHYELGEGECDMLWVQANHITCSPSLEACISYWIEIMPKEEGEL